MNTEQYVHLMTWLQALTGLIEQMQVFFFALLLLLLCALCLFQLKAEQLCFAHYQVHRDPASQAVVQEWIREREAMR